MLTLPFGPLIEAIWLERRKRFMVDVRLACGETITAHCPNTGAMTGVSEPGSRVLLSSSANPKRRYAHTLEAVRVGSVWVGVNTQNPNRVALALARAGLPPFETSAAVKPEVRYGKAERIDILLTGEDGRRTFVEVKNVHLVERTGEASFPDCVTARAAKHLDALADVARTGDRALMLFLIQRGDVDRMRLARHIDPQYGDAFDRAVGSGVEVRALACKVGRTGIAANRIVPVLDLASTRSPASSPLPRAA